MSKLNVLFALVLICSLSFTLSKKLKKSKSKYKYYQEPQPYPGEVINPNFQPEPFALKLRNAVKGFVNELFGGRK